jgi:hypothetical protein
LWSRRSGAGAVGGSRRAATGVRNDRGARPQTVEDHDRRFWYRWPLTWRSSRVFTVLNTMQFLAGMPGADLARRKPGVQIPSPPPPTLQVRASPASSRRRSPHVAAALRPQAQATGQPRGSQRPADPAPDLTQRPHSVVTASHPAGRSSHASSLSRSTWPTANDSHDDDQVDPPLAQHGLRQLRGQAPTSLRRPTVVDMAGDHADPGIPAVRLPAPAPRSATSFPSDTADAWNGRTSKAGHWTPGRSDARTGHRSRGQAPVGHRPFAPDTGHRTPDTGCRTRTRTR